jgi:hypothetical protein
VIPEMLNIQIHHLQEKMFTSTNRNIIMETVTKKMLNKIQEFYIFITCLFDQ